MKQFIPEGGVDRIPDFDPRTGDHFWVLFALYEVDPVEVYTPDTQIHLDNENLVHLGAVGCFHCEAVYDPRLLKRRCPGRPR